jgi:multidrug efflux system outer membrane protein
MAAGATDVSLGRLAPPRGLLIPLVFLLTGCTVGPNYKRPSMDPPTQYRFVGDQTQAESFADLPWWRVFDDAALQALIREAISRNLDLRAAVARVEIARAQAGIAKSFLYPQVDAAASYTTRQTVGGSQGTGDVQKGGVYGFQLAWELDLFGRIRREHEAAVALMLASEQGRRGVLVTLVGDVASTYFLLRQLDLELEISRRTLVNNDRTVDYFQTRLDGGVSNRLEVDRIRANREVTAAKIPEVEQQIAVAEDALSVLLARPPGPITRSPLTIDAALAPAIPPGVPASLLERRPDVVAAEQRLVAANADVGAAKALFFPDISLTGFLGGLSGQVLSLLSSSSGGIWSVSPGVLQPVFNGGRLKNNLAAARASFDESVALYQKAALNGYREVADALIAIAKLAEVRSHQQTGVDQLQDAATLARDRYQSGLASYLDVLNADQQLYDQQLQLAQTRGSEFRARSELYRALGGGWQP